MLKDLNQWVVTAVLVLCTTAAVTQASASDAPFRRAERLVSSGSPAEALAACADIIRDDPSHRKARRLAERLAPEVIAAEEEATAKDTAGGRAEVALPRLTALRTRLRGLSAAGLSMPDSSALDLLHDETMALAAAAELTAAREAAEAGRWGAAVAHAEAAMNHPPSASEARRLKVSALLRWAQDDLDSARYRQAAKRLASAAEAGDRDAGLRASKLFALLGLHHLNTGHCRAAIADLRLARNTDAASVSPDDLKRAARCAATSARLVVRADAPSDGPSGPLAQPVTAAILERAGARASEHFRIAANPDHRPNTATVRVRLTDMRSDRTTPSSSPSQTQVRQSVPCTERGPNGRILNTSCWTEIDVNYETYTERMTGRLTAVVDIEDANGDVLLAGWPVSVTGTQSVIWAGNVVGIQSRDPFAMPGSVSGGNTLVFESRVGSQLAVGERRAKARAALVTELVGRLSEEVAALLLGRLDAAAMAPDPPVLPAVGL